MFTFLQPETFQGRSAQAPYFEEWYFHLHNGKQTLALTPGICYAPKPFAYLQIAEPAQHLVHFYRYSIKDFHARPGRFNFSLGRHLFSSEQILLNGNGWQGEVDFTERVPFSEKRYHTGMMGPFAFYPKMSCKHAVITIQSPLSGAFFHQEEPYVFSGGNGYVEKDWGKTFPRPYLWIQAHFPLGTFTLSLARLSVLGGMHTGALVLLYTQGKRFFSSNCSGLHLTHLTQTEDQVWHLQFSLPTCNLALSFSVSTESLSIRVPSLHGVNRQVKEDFQAPLSLRFYSKHGQTLFSTQTTQAIVETDGDLHALLPLTME